MSGYKLTYIGFLVLIGLLIYLTNSLYGIASPAFIYKISNILSLNQVKRSHTDKDTTNGVISNSAQQKSTISKPSSKQRSNSTRVDHNSSKKPQVIKYNLLPISVRSDAAINNLVISRNIKSVVLELATESSAKGNNWQARLYNFNNKQIFQQHIATIKTKEKISIVEVQIPAEILATGEYLLELVSESGEGQFEATASYTFSVKEKQ